MDARFAAAAKLRLGFNLHTLGILARGVVLFVVTFAAAYGFVAGSRATPYDPHLFAMGISTLFAFACVGAAALYARNRLLHARIAWLKQQMEDLTDRAWELGEAEDRSRRFLEAQGDMIVRRAPDSRITYANDAFCALAGLEREDLVGTPRALAVADQGGVTQLPDGTRLHDQKITTAAGPRWIAWREVPVRSDGKEPEILSVGRDVTDRVRAEQALAEARDAAQAASRAKSRFLATVSHEIRTPLNGILGMTDLLLDTALTPEQTTYAEAVKASGDTLLAMIDEILDFSKIEAGKLDLEARPFAVRPLIEHVVELMAPRAHAKDLEIGCYVDPRLHDEMLGDAARLRQVLLNLVGNAIKFTARGGVAVTAELGWPAREVRFRVRDTGIGIAADAQERIFAEFEQADGEASRNFGGSGLGLAISKRIVERMGGRIAIDSRPSQGSTFEVAVPLGQIGKIPGEDRTLGGVSAVIASPGSIEADLVARYLRDWGAAVGMAASEADASGRIAVSPEAVLIVDLALGLQPACALAERGRRAARRIVLLPPASRPDLAELSRAGFDSYLIKPVRASSLRMRLDPGATAVESSRGGDQVEHSAEPGLPCGVEMSLLLAEDNEINALLASTMLRKLGQKPTVVQSGTAAIETWRAAQAAGTPFAAVLMDLHMPGIDGIEATRRIRGFERIDRCRPTPIFALTANAFADDRQACLDAGMNGVLIKPLERERLKELLDSLGVLAAGVHSAEKAAVC